MWYECDSLFSLLCYDFVHTDVEWFCRNFFYYLKRKANADFVCGRYAGKQPIVVSLSSSQPVSVTVECYPRNNDKVYCGIVGEQCSRRLLDAIRSDSKVGRTCIYAKFQIVTYDNRQEYFFLCTPFSDEVMCVYFVR